MSNLSKEIGGEPVHVKDCYVWSNIYYLDSTTDYRECLPQHGVSPRSIHSDDLVMLDSSRRVSGRRPLPWAHLSWVLVVAFLTLCGLFWCGSHNLL